MTLNAYYHAFAGAEVAEPDPAETSEVGWSRPRRPAAVAFPDTRRPSWPPLARPCGTAGR